MPTAGSRTSRIEIDDLIKLRSPSSPALSPDGERMVFVQKSTDLDKNRYHHNLILVDIQSEESHPLTSGECSDTSPDWTADSRNIVFVSDRGGQANLWRIALDGGEAEQLTKLNGLVRSPKVSPDGKYVAFLYAPQTQTQRMLAAKQQSGPRYRHLTRLSYKLDGHGFWDDAWMHLYVLELESRNIRQLTFGKYHDGQHSWSPNSRSLAFVSNRIPRADVHTSNSDVYVVSAKGGSPRQLTKKRGAKCAPSWSPDGKSIAFIGHTSYPDWVENMHVMLVAARSGPIVDLMPDADMMCSNLAISDAQETLEGTAPQPLWSRDGRRLFFLASVEGSVNIYEIPADGGQPKARSRGRHEIEQFVQSKDGSRWIFLRRDAVSPGDLFVASAGSKRRNGLHKPARGERDLVPGAEVRRLTRINQELLRRKKVQTPKQFHVQSKDGHSIHGWVLYAKGRPKRAPAVLMVHGGPYAMYAWSFFHEFQMLAAAGYHVFFPNIRGSVGYGRDYMRAIIGKWGHEDFRDVTEVTDWIESRPYVDKHRIAIAGGSYGGFMTNWAIGHTRRFKCAITQRSVVNMLSFYGSSDMGWEFHEEFQAHPWESFERYWRTSPLAFVQLMKTPLLIIHSDEDHRCPVSQAEELFTALKLLNRDTEMIRFIGESHGLSRGGRPHNRLERLRRILDWFERKL